MNRLRDNRTQIVRTAVAGRIAPVRFHTETLNIDRNGRLTLLPGSGGINLDVHCGDPVDQWLADHLMVGASIEDAESLPASPGALHLLACLGNTVRDAAGRTIGVVAGKRGGLAPDFFPPNLVAVEMPDTVAELLKPSDRVVVEAYGRGLVLTDRTELVLANLSPSLLDAMPLREERDRLVVDVTAILPARVAGAGLGSDRWIGDLEITEMEPLIGNTASLHFGDLVAFDGIDARTNRFFNPECVAIGAVAHGPSPAPGHGVGVTILMTGPRSVLQPQIDSSSGFGAAFRRLTHSIAFATPDNGH
jgi:hypothetical protein